MGFHMHTSPYNISEFINDSICRMGKNIIYLLPMHFFLPPQAKLLQMTVFIILESMEINHSVILTPISVANTAERN